MDLKCVFSLSLSLPKYIIIYARAHRCVKKEITAEEMRGRDINTHTHIRFIFNAENKFVYAYMKIIIILKKLLF